MKQRYLILTLMLVFGLASTAALAQQRIVSGTIRDSRGNSLPGVNIIVKGTSAGTVTDANGKYNLSVPENANTLVFSFIGYASREVEIGTQTTIDIAMDEDVKQLSEVVVDDLVGDIALLLVFDPHKVLFGLIAGKDDDLFRGARNSCKKPSREYLAE